MIRRLAVALTALLMLAAAASVAREVRYEPYQPAELCYRAIATPDSTAPGFCVFDPSTCRPDNAWLLTDAARAYGDIAARVADASCDSLPAIIRALKTSVRASKVFNEGANGPRLRESLAAELQWVAEQLNPSENTAFGDIAAGFTSHQRRKRDLWAPDIFFDGTTNQIVFRESSVPDSVPPNTYIPDNWTYYTTIDQAIEIRTVCGIARDAFARARQERLQDVAAYLGKSNRGWTNYLENGYSQYPWESFLNSTLTPRLFGEFSWYDPPNEQLVLLHPELCTLIDARSRREASAEPALLVHGFGYVRYMGSERDWFLGLSASACLGGDEFGLAYGPTMHFNHIRLGSNMPHISAGILWFDAEDGRNGPLLTVAVDFWRVLNEEGPRELFLPLLEQPGESPQ